MDLTIDKGRPLTGRRASGAREEWSCVSGRLPVSHLLGPAHAASIAGGFDRRLEAAGSAQKQHIRLGVKQPGKPAIHKPAAGTHKARLGESPGRLEGNPPNRAFPLPASLESSPALSLSGGGPPEAPFPCTVKGIPLKKGGKVRYKLYNIGLYYNLFPIRGRNPPANDPPQPSAAGASR